MPPALHRRTDRHVARVRLRAGPGAPVHLMAFRVEEALRLCTLPGEEHGRVYHFRRVRLSGLPGDGDRTAWLATLRRELLALAASAVHGADPRAPGADAVFFRSGAEAAGSLLARLARRLPADAWFWPSVCGTPPGTPPAERLAGLVERLRATPAGWAAVAAAILPPLETTGPAPLLHLLSDAAARHWLRQIGGDPAAWPDPGHTPAPPGPAPGFGSDPRPPVPPVPPIQLPAPARTILAAAAAPFGPGDPRVLFLAGLAVLLARPADPPGPATIAQARATLAVLAVAAPGPAPVHADAAPPTPAPNPDPPVPALLGPDSLAPAPSPHPGPAPHLLVPDSSPPPSPPSATATIPRLPPHDPAPETPLAPQCLASRCLAEATQGAGLYFLLNALRHLPADASPLDPPFLAHLFQHVARHTGIADDDPILLWTRDTLADADPDPVGFHPIGLIQQVRTKALHLRRWCRRTAGIAMHELVRRPGEVTLTRTDLDVTLALDQADVRIRRAGLDLDPGWLPWFGRVVRFHYLTRPPFARIGRYV